MRLPACLLMWLLSSLEAASQDEVSLEGVDEFVAAALEEFEVPGLAVAVVKDGKVVLARGYGLRDVEADKPVTERTLFAIGSISKSFTATVVCDMAAEGLLELDEPVQTQLPGFQLFDPVASAGMTPRDLLCHRSGLPRHDLMWYASGLGRVQIFERLRFLEPNQEFRAAWQYQNLMFMTAGYLAGQRSGSTWEEQVRARVFTPLGMERSNFSVLDSVKDADFSFPYGEVDDQRRRIPFRNIDEIGPAGSINSSVEEMIRYVQMHLDDGRFGEERVVPGAMVKMMRTPQMVMPGGDPPEVELGPSSYGLGWMITTYRGQALVQHGGGIDGFISLLSMLPDQDAGMIVLSNLGGQNPVPNLVSRYLYDRLLGLDPVDWTGRTKEQIARAAEGETENEADVGRRTGTQPSHALADYHGKYQHPAYGTIRIGAAGEALSFELHGQSSTLEHWHYDIFKVAEVKGRVMPFAGVFVTFHYDRQGEIDRVLMPLEPQVDDIEFRRAANPSALDLAAAARFAGTYVVRGQELEIRLEDGALWLDAPDSPRLKLLPLKARRFMVDGEEEVQVEFVIEGESVTALRIHQPGGSGTARRSSPAASGEPVPAPEPEETSELLGAETEMPKLPVLHRLPVGWRARTPDSSMRLVEYLVDTGSDLLCIVFYFGEGGGGSTQANLDRWKGQFEPAEPAQTRIDEPAPGLKATTMEVHGTYVAETTPGSGERHQRPDWRMIGTVLECPRGPLFIKLVGPGDAVAAQREAYRAWIASFRSSEPG